MSEVYGIELNGEPLEWGVSVENLVTGERKLTLKYRTGTRNTVIGDKAAVESVMAFIENCTGKPDIKLVVWSRSP